jgi:N-acetylmuramoyl-L-alanine amidase
MSRSAAVLTAVLALSLAAQAQAPAPFTLLTKEGRRPLPVRVIDGQEMFALDDLARVFDLQVREDALAGGVTISTKTQTIVMTPGQGLASVGGRVVSLPAPPVREGRSWFLPIDFVPRALAPALGTRLDLRRPSRLLVVGDVRVPRVTVRIEPQPVSARVTFEVAPATPHSVAQEGSRLVVRFEAEALDAALPSSPVPELVESLRPGEPPASIVLELGPKFASFRAADAPGTGGAARIVIDVLSSTTESPPAPTTPPVPSADPLPTFDLTPGGLRTIVIDAGHGGDELGARGPQGTLEKDVTLGVARRLRAAIEARLGARVILTREGDQTVGLDERAAVANNNKADLFISLHANASVRAAASGAEVFFLSLQEYGVEAQRAANAPRESLPVFGGGTRDIEVVQWRLAQARHIQESETLAKIVEAALRERVALTPRSLQQAPFRVLVGANMPAVLVEMGFMTNPQQETQLASDVYQNNIVQALVESIVQFRAQRGAPALGAAAVR